MKATPKRQGYGDKGNKKKKELCDGRHAKRSKARLAKIEWFEFLYYYNLFDNIQN